MKSPVLLYLGQDSAVHNLGKEGPRRRMHCNVRSEKGIQEKSKKHRLVRLPKVELRQ